MRIFTTAQNQGYVADMKHVAAAFDKEGVTLHQGRNVVKRFTLPDGTVWIVKRYKRPNLVQRIAYTFFKKSKAERAYRYAQLLLDRGIDTPAGIACILTHQGGLLADSYFISTACTDPPVFPQLVATGQYDTTLADRLAAFFAFMHSRGVLHGDPNLNNILYHTDGQGETHFTVIDTNRSKFKSCPTRRQCLDNLKRVTHRRDLMQYIVRSYARLRGWDTEESVAAVFKALKRFERQKKLRRLFRKKKK